MISLLIFLISYSWASCNLKEFRWTGIPFDKNHVYHQECEPEALYSWVTSPNIIDTNDPDWPVKRGKAYFFRTPLGTSEYGTFSYRVKLKKGLQFKEVTWASNCPYPEEEKKHTVYVVNDQVSGFSEYFLCSNDPIESWSFAMRDHYIEMVNEYNFAKTVDPKELDGLTRPEGINYCANCYNAQKIHDARNPNTFASLHSSIQLMLSWVQAGRGKVFDMNSRRAFTSGPIVDSHFSRTLNFIFHKAHSAAGATTSVINIRSVSANSRLVDHRNFELECYDKNSCRIALKKSDLEIGFFERLKIVDFQYQCCKRNGACEANIRHVSNIDKVSQKRFVTLSCD